MLVEDRVDLGILEGAEQQCLPVELGPVVEIQHPHSGEVDPVGIQRQQVHVLHQVLHRESKTHRPCSQTARALTAARNRAGRKKTAQNSEQQRSPKTRLLEVTDHSKSNLLDLPPQSGKLPSPQPPGTATFASTRLPGGSIMDLSVCITVNGPEVSELKKPKCSSQPSQGEFGCKQRNSAHSGLPG